VKFLIGQKVEKIGGDYQFDGEIVAVFTKRDKTIRIVVEDDRGVLLVFNPRNIQLKVMETE
jgi:hypothetical protein